MSMEPKPRSLRYEIKMQCEQIQFPTVQSWTRLHSAGFREAYPPRQVNNLYFDTPGLDSYNDHIESVTERRKLRFRWYGPDLDSACGQLEIKSKRERAGWKQVQPVDAILNLRACDWFDTQRTILSGLRDCREGIFQELLHVSHPLVINTYQREYFVSADERVRLTLDYDLKVYDQWMSARPNLTFITPMLDNMVIEFKCEVQHSRHLADILAEFPLRVNRNSKYVTALDSMLDR